MPRVKKPKPEAPAAGGLSKFQTFEMVTVHRSELKAADYNPRIIDKHARKKIRDRIRKDGLVMPIVWNKRTGNIVGGHQRVDIIDSEEGSQDYKLTVSAIDVDEATEKQLNVFLNNQSAMGNWDLEALGALLAEDEKNGDAMGFDRIDIQTLFPDGLASMFAEDPAEEQIQQLEEIANDANAVQDKADIEKLTGEPAPDFRQPVSATGVPVQNEKRRDGIKQREKNWAGHNPDRQFYLVLVFENQDQAGAFLDNLNMEAKGGKYVDGTRLAENLGIPLGEDEPDG